MPPRSRRSTGCTARSRCRSCCRRVRRRAVGRGGRAHPAPARRVLLAADAGALGADLRDLLPLDRGHRRRGRTGRPRARQPRAGQFRQFARLLHPGRADRPRRALRAAARGPLAVRPRARRDPREPAARHVPGLPRRPLQAGGVRPLGGGHRARRCVARIPVLPGLGGGRFGRVLRRVAGDGGHRRHAPASWVRRWARCSSSCSASCFRSGLRTGCCGSASCSSASCCTRPAAWSASGPSCSGAGGRRRRRPPP